MVYGVLRFINFAHSDVMMLGAVAAYYLSPRINGLFAPQVAGQPPTPTIAGALIVFVLSALICAAIGVTIEYLAYRPLRHRPRLTVLITAIGVSLLIENMAQHPKMFGAATQPFGPLIGGKGLLIGNLYVSSNDLIVLVVTTILLA